MFTSSNYQNIIGRKGKKHASQSTVNIWRSGFILSLAKPNSHQEFLPSQPSPAILSINGLQIIQAYLPDNTDNSASIFERIKADRIYETR